MRFREPIGVRTSLNARRYGLQPHGVIAKTVRLQTAPTVAQTSKVKTSVMNIRRYYVPNAIVFITQVVDRRIPIFQQQPPLDLLLATLREVKRLHPFTMLGYVFLLEHFHLLLRPTGASNFSDIMHSLKPNFTKEYKKLVGVTGSMKFWQKGFWDHLIRDEDDLRRHLDYIHYNPVHHSLVEKPEAWVHSSYRHWQQHNVYPQQWGWSLPASVTNYDWGEAEEDHDS